MSEQVKAALIWIKDILESQQVQYQIVGGLAANIHGGSREVADIDLYITKPDVSKVLPFINDFISKPLAHYAEISWDLEYFQLIYQSQKIEIGISPGTKIRGLSSDKWVAIETKFEQSVRGDYCSIVVPVIPVSDLVAYKRILGREVDLIDIFELTGESAP